MRLLHPARLAALCGLLAIACRALAQLSEIPGSPPLAVSPSPPAETPRAPTRVPTTPPATASPTAEIPIPVDVQVISPSNIANLTSVWELPSDDPIYLAAWSPQENRIGIATGHGIELRGFPALQLEQTILDGPDFAFGQDEGTLFAGSSGAVTVWDLSRAAVTNEYRDPYDWTASATFALATNGGTLASNVGTPLVHGVFIVLHIWDVDSGRKLLTISEDGIGGSYQLAFSPDGEEVASGSRLDGRVHFWDTRTGERVGRVEGEAVQYSTDGKVVATSKGTSIWIWDTQTKGLATRIDVAGTEADVPFAFSPDGALLAAGQDRLTIWGTDDWTELVTLVIPSGTLRSLRFSPSGRYLVSVSGETRQGDSGGRIDEYVATLWAIDR